MVTYCSVDGCSSTAYPNSSIIGMTGLSFFRCPKNRERCQRWKNALGFIGAHRYANFTPQECFARVKICSLHFTPIDFVNSRQIRLNYDAVPSLLLPQISDGVENEMAFEDFGCRDVQVQTEILQKDKSCQTSMQLTANSPRKKILRQKIKFLEKTAASTSKGEKEINLEDVFKFLDKNYPDKYTELIKSQLFLLKASPKGSRCPKDIADMDVDELESSLDQDVITIENEFSVHDFNMEALEEGEGEKCVEVKPLMIPYETDIQNKCFDKTVKEFSVHDFNMEVFDEDEGEKVVEEKPLIIPNESDILNKCFDKTVKEEINDSEEDRDCKFQIKIETVNLKNEESCEKFIKSGELIIKHEEHDFNESDGYIDKPDRYIDTDDVDICSECTVIVSVNNNPVLMGTAERAIQTVPKGTLALKYSNACISGVYTLRQLEKGVQLGPYEGHTIKVESTGGYSWKLSKGKLVDASDETSSNYLRYINYAKDISEQNLVAFQCNGELYYRTCRYIEKGAELLIYFDNNLDEAYCEPSEEKPNKEFHWCQFCHLGFKFEAHRVRHQMFCKTGNNESHVGSLCKHFAVSTVPKYKDDENQIGSLEPTMYDTCSYAANKNGDFDGQKNVFECEVCDYKTHVKIYLIRHKLQHKQEDVFECAECDYKTHVKSYLADHNRRKHKQEDMFECAECDYKTHVKSYLADHNRRKHKQDVFECAECDYKTHLKRYLTRHNILKHKQQDVFECDFCDYDTYDKFLLNVHRKRKHKQEDVFECAECDYKTHVKCYLVAHNKRKHKQENAFECAECDYKTHVKMYLDKHNKRKHTKDVL